MAAFKNSLTWNRAVDLSISIHRIVCRFPSVALQRDEMLRARLLNAAVKVSDGIADSYDTLKYTPSEMLRMARYHLSETEFLLDCSLHMGYVEEQEYGRLAEEMRTLRGLINREMQPRG